MEHSNHEILEHHVIGLSNYQDNLTIYVLSYQPQIDS
jgi:hypothetical protein